MWSETCKGCHPKRRWKLSPHPRRLRHNTFRRNRERKIINHMTRLKFFALCRNLITIKDFPFSLEGGQTSAEVIQEEECWNHFHSAHWGTSWAEFMSGKICAPSLATFIFAFFCSKNTQIRTSAMQCNEGQGVRLDWDPHCLSFLWVS